MKNMDNQKRIWNSVAKRLQYFGPEERSVDTEGSQWRVTLPESYMDAERGFPDLLKDRWTLAYRDDDLLVAIPSTLYPLYLANLRHTLCDSGTLKREVFNTLFESFRYEVSLDKRNRWRINVQLQHHMPSTNASGGYGVVFQTRDATIEIRGMARFRREVEAAQAEIRKISAYRNTPENPRESAG
jgi:hypothetical protein